MPKSPWMASAACMKTAEVPVEFIVAAIFWAMMALLPTPENTMVPLFSSINCTTFSKVLSMEGRRARKKEGEGDTISDLQ